jgi:hypothetical protein
MAGYLVLFGLIFMWLFILHMNSIRLDRNNKLIVKMLNDLIDTVHGVKKP